MAVCPIVIEVMDNGGGARHSPFNFGSAISAIFVEFAIESFASDAEQS